MIVQMKCPVCGKVWKAVKPFKSWPRCPKANSTNYEKSHLKSRALELPVGNS